MKPNKRMPLIGAICIIIILASMVVSLQYRCKNLNSQNDMLNATIVEQSKTISSLNLNKTKLNLQIHVLTKEKEMLLKANKKNNKDDETRSTTNQTSTTKTNSTSLGSFKVTGYCNCSKCCGKWAGGLTASKTVPNEGRTIAVDPNIIPLGTKVIIDGHTYIAEDTGSAIKGKKIDLYFDSHQEASDWGVQYKDVKIVT